METMNYPSSENAKQRPMDWQGDIPSLQSRCLVALLRLLPIKKRLASAGAVQKKVKKLMWRPAPYGPKGLGSDIELRLENKRGWPVYYTAPDKNYHAGDIVVFLHGGGYINEIVKAHWRFIRFLTLTAQTRCVVPIYPLAPGATAVDVVPAMGELLREVIETAGLTKVTIIGNSAGAALGLAVCQWLHQEGYRQPDGLVLISPGVDAALDHPDQESVAQRDPIQAIPGVKEVARLYAGALDTTHPFISPLHGDFSSLPRMQVFSGTLDLHYPGCIHMVAKAKAAGVPVEFWLKTDQPHNYAAMPTPEGKEARKAILRFLAQDACDMM